MPEKPESLPTSGVLTSPNFPANYPLDLHERKTIEVAKGSVIKIHFTDFNLEVVGQLEGTEPVDYLEITDGDGTMLERFGEMWSLPHDVTSNSETVHILFHTDESVTRSGWRLEWSK